jgi:UDP-N-acetylmuramate--alanine ligase
LLEQVKRVHFIGIGGYGMSALALVLTQMGYEVSGSDLRSSRLTERLSRQGAKINYGHKATYVHGAELVVYSTAIPEDNLELVEARRLNIPLWHRSELLAALMNTRCGVAVTGTHGKTTTTAMISLILERAGLDPTVVIGGELANFGANARLGRGKFLVAEACESDNSFLRYHSHLAVITNIEADHLEHYGGKFSRLVDGYRSFLGNVREGGCVVLCSDDARLRAIKKELQTRVLTYGLNGVSDISAKEISFLGLGSSFKVQRGEEVLGEIKLNVPGCHNISNSLAALSVALEAGVTFDVCRQALAEFRGAGRRFEIIGESEGVVVIDDYAHHPTEIKATLQAAKGSGRRVICVFQPHRYTRTSYLMDDFAGAFDDADILFINKVYSAGEAAIPGATAAALSKKISDRNNRTEGQLYQIDDQDEIVAQLLRLTRPGDLVLTMGAGDIWQVGRKFLQQLQEGHEEEGEEFVCCSKEVQA